MAGMVVVEREEMVGDDAINLFVNAAMDGEEEQQRLIGLRSFPIL